MSPTASTRPDPCATLMADSCAADRQMGYGLLIPPMLLLIFLLGWWQTALACLHIVVPVALLLALGFGRLRKLLAAPRAAIPALPCRLAA